MKQVRRVRWARVSALAGLLFTLAVLAGWLFTGEEEGRPRRQSPLTEERVAPVPVETRHSCTSNLDDIIRNVLERDLGTTFHAAVYDSLVWPFIATTPPSSSQEASSPFGGPARETWMPFLRRSGTNASTAMDYLQPSQRTLAGRLLLLHQLTSIGIGRLTRDAEVERLVIKNRRVAVPLVRRFLRDLVSRFVTHLQTIIDLDETGLRARVSAVHPWIDFHIEDDPLIRVLAHMNHNSTVGDVQRLLGSWRALPPRTHPRHSNYAATPCGAFGRTLVLEYHRLGFAATEPRSAKLWNTLRPTTSCSSVVRSCEDPEGGCRFLCNPDYVVDAVSEPSGGGGGVSLYIHRMIGVGSNNEWGWEEGLWRLFHADTTVGSNLTTTTRNRVGSLTTLDCTVSSFRPSFVLEEELRGFRVASYCVDQTARDTADDDNDNAGTDMPRLGARRRRSQRFITLPELKSLVLHAEAQASTTMPSLDLKATAVSPRLPQNVTVADPLNLYFDELTLLKLDVEGFEHPILSSWAQLDARQAVGDAQRLQFALEMREVGAGCSSGALSPGSSFFRTSMLQVEIHEPVVEEMSDPGGQANAVAVVAALQLQRLALYLASLGFMPVAGEHSGMLGSCCSEYLFVHFRYFVRSEMWVASQDP